MCKTNFMFYSNTMNFHNIPFQLQLNVDFTPFNKKIPYKTIRMHNNKLGLVSN